MRLKSTEAETQRAIMELLAAYKIFAGRINTGAGWNGNRPILHHTFGAGCADILAFVKFDIGILQSGFLPLWIEVKSQDGRQSALQAEFEAFVKKQGHEYLLARSVDAVSAWLKDHGVIR